MLDSALAFLILPANRGKMEVDPTRLELVTSAMRGRHEGLQGFSGAYKTPANGSILMVVLFSAGQDIYWVAARLLHRFEYQRSETALHLFVGRSPDLN